MPTRTVWAGRMAGPSPCNRPSSTGSPPRSAASGMPCTLPDSLVAGLFMSPWASTQIRPIGFPLLHGVGG